VPATSQLSPITHLGTDCKLLTKILVVSLLPVLPCVLLYTQLCSVRGRSILAGLSPPSLQQSTYIVFRSLAIS
jgi:hypothetical protein